MTEKLTYALTDAHGCFELFEEARYQIVRHASGRDAQIVYLGDYVDRGAGSASIIEALVQGIGEPNFEEIFLKGNHEDMMLGAIHELDYAPGMDTYNFMRNGGDKTIASYGGSLHLMPDSHVQFLKDLKLFHETDTHIFVHAGIPRPHGVDLKDCLHYAAEHEPETLMWIRHQFLVGDHDFGKHVVHGHTPNERGPELMEFRTNLDVGAVWTDRMVVAVFEPGNMGTPDHILNITLPNNTAWT